MDISNFDAIRTRQCIDNVTSESAKLYASRNYRSHGLQTTAEFENDYRHITSVGRIIIRYLRHEDDANIPARKLVNHVILLSNVFGIEPTIKILLACFPEVFWPCLVTIFEYLNFSRSNIKYINGLEIIMNQIPLDMRLLKLLERSEK